MPIEVRCPSCQAGCIVADDQAGVPCSCPSCGCEFDVAASAAPPPIPPPIPPTSPEGVPVVMPVQVGYATAQGGNGKAVASLVLGIVSIPACIVYGIPSLICGILAVVFAVISRRAIRRMDMSPSAGGMARGGLICGIVGIVLSLLFWGMIIVFFFYVTRSISSSMPSPSSTPMMPIAPTYSTPPSSPGSPTAPLGGAYDPGPPREIHGPSGRVYVPDDGSTPSSGDRFYGPDGRVYVPADGSTPSPDERIYGPDGRVYIRIDGSPPSPPRSDQAGGATHP